VVESQPNGPSTISCIQVFSLTGSSLSSVGTFSLGERQGSSGIVVAPSGNQLYVANSQTGRVSALAVDGSGKLSRIAPDCETGGEGSTGIGISPAGTFVYVTNTYSNNLSVFKVCIAVSVTCPRADGSLIRVDGCPFSSGVGPTVVQAHPT